MLVHGIGSRRGVWDPVVDRLAVERDVLAVDLPGFGDSPMLPDGVVPTVQVLADAVAAWWGELGIERPHVAGNSLGGGVALELARKGAVSSATALSTERAADSTVSAELRVAVAAPETSLSTATTMSVPCAAPATFSEISPVAAFCCSTEAATAEV